MQSKYLRLWGLGSHEVPSFLSHTASPPPRQWRFGARWPSPRASPSSRGTRERPRRRRRARAPSPARRPSVSVSSSPGSRRIGSEPPRWLPLPGRPTWTRPGSGTMPSGRAFAARRRTTRRTRAAAGPTSSPTRRTPSPASPSTVSPGESAECRKPWSTTMPPEQRRAAAARALAARQRQPPGQRRQHDVVVAVDLQVHRVRGDALVLELHEHLRERVALRLRR